MTSPRSSSAATNGPFGAPDENPEVAALVEQLLAPLTDEQQLVVNVTADAFFKSAKRWPTFQYVQAILDRERLDARLVLATFPIAGTSVRYAAFRCTPWSGSLNDDTQVELTVVGLHHYKGTFTAEGETLVRDALRLLQVFVDARRGFIPPPTEVKHLQLTSDDVLARLRPVQHDLPPAYVLAGLVQTEPPLFASIGGAGSDGTAWTWTIARNLLDFDGIDLDVEEYVRRLVTKYHTPRRVEQRVVESPLSLPAALGYLDTAWRVMEGRDSHLFVLPSPERAAALAFDAGTRAEYLERVAALGDVLKCLKVPAGGQQKGGHPIARLRIYLRSKLPPESHARISLAFDQLVYVTDIRNGGLHAEAEPAALRAYQALGIDFPITDPSAAWNAVRGATVLALDTLREEVLGYVDSPSNEAMPQKT